MAETKTLDGATLRILGGPRDVPVPQIRREEKREAIVLGPETRAWLREQLAAFDEDPERCAVVQGASRCQRLRGHAGFHGVSQPEDRCPEQRAAAAGGHERQRCQGAQAAFKLALQRREQIDESPLSFTTWLRAMAEI